VHGIAGVRGRAALAAGGGGTGRLSTEDRLSTQGGPGRVAGERRQLLALLGLLTLLPGCASDAGPARDDAVPGASGGVGPDAFPAGPGAVAFYDAASGAPLGRRQLLKRMVPAPIVLLGEVHDNTLHHRIRAALLRDWVRSRPARPAAVVFEQLDREHDEALRLAQKQRRQPGFAGASPADAMAQLLEAARFDRQAWAWPAHRPLFEAAQESGATWIAANLSRVSARRLSRDPAAEVDPTLTAMVESARWSEPAQQALAQALLDGHCGALPAAAVAGMARIQRLRDAALALPLLDASERRSMLIAGNGHVRRDYGVPLYLGALEKEALVVGFEEVDGTPGAATLTERVGARRAAEYAGAYDFVCLTDTPRTEDPCAAMKPRAEGAAGQDPS
jgi:uncharacterized iron-regulated protein